MHELTKFTSNTSFFNCYNEKEKTYFKVNVKNRVNNIEILKNGKKLKGRKIASQVNTM